MKLIGTRYEIKHKNRVYFVYVDQNGVTGEYFDEFSTLVKVDDKDLLVIFVSLIKAGIETYRLENAWTRPENPSTA